MTAPVYRFTCGHVGRINDSDRAKTQAFIRVAEVRDARVGVERKACPDCSTSARR